MSDRSLMLFAGNANRPLAQEIANYLKAPLGQAVSENVGKIQVEAGAVADCQ